MYEDPVSPVQQLYLHDVKETSQHASDLVGGGFDDNSLQKEDKQFLKMYEELVQWYQVHRTSYVPFRVFDNPTLGWWSRKMRSAWRKGLLTEKQKARLSMVAFDPKPNQLDCKWHDNYHKLREWKQLKGHLDLAPDYKDPDRPDFEEAGRWLHRQKELYVEQRLLRWKVRMLRSLGVKLTRPKGPPRHNLHPLLQGLDPVTYRRLAARNPAVTAEGRRQFKKYATQAEETMVADPAALQEAPKSPTDRSARSPRPSLAPSSVSPNPHQPEFGVKELDVRQCDFFQMLRRLKNWRDRYDSTLVPLGVFDNALLAEWVRGIRRAAKRPGILPAWQVAELERLRFEWEPNVEEAKWYANFHHLRRWKARYGHVDIPQDYQDPEEPAWVEVARWVPLQVQTRLKGRLPREKLRLLKRLGLHFPKRPVPAPPLSTSYDPDEEMQKVRYLGPHVQTGHPLFTSEPLKNKKLKKLKPAKDKNHGSRLVLDGAKTDA